MSTSTTIRTLLHERIEQLNENQLEQLRDLVNENFPERKDIQKPKKKRKLGAMKGKIWLSDDWDSPETNEEIARTFYESEIFPKNK